MICAPAAARPAFRVGAWDRNGREHSEDGADDHISKKRLGVCAGKEGSTVSEWQGRKEKAQCLCEMGDSRFRPRYGPASIGGVVISVCD